MNLKGKNVRGKIKPILAILIVVAFVVGYFLGGTGPEAPVPEDPHAGHEHTETADGAGEAETVWTCSMHPNIQLPEAGQCPICFMDLIPLVKGGDESVTVSLRQVKLSETARKLAEVALAEVEYRTLSVQTRMVGKVDYDETRQGAITAWMNGRIDRMYVDYTGQFVKKGQAMVSIYSPELLTAQAELIQAVKAIGDLSGSKLELVRETARRTERAAREKLRLLGLTQGQIAAVIKRGTPSEHIILRAPMSGIVTTKEVDEGMYVQTGSVIYRIADLSHVWVVLDAYESDLPWVKLGQQVRFSAEAFPGKMFSGKVVYIDPVVDPMKRTVRVRLGVPNADYSLKPGMFVRAVQKSEAAEEPVLVIPASAPLVTGKRAVVYVAVPGEEGVYEGREIVLGPRAGGFYVVKSGLTEGEKVVTKGNFKIDSAVQIMAKPSMMSPESGAPAPAAHVHDHGDGAEMAEMAALPAPAAYDVPGLFVSNLTPLAGDYDRLEKAVESGDLTATREAFKGFYNRICAVDPTSLAGDAALAYKELSMLLTNDSLIGSESEDMGTARYNFEQVKAHYTRLYNDFGLASGAQERALAAAVPAEFKAQLGRVFAAYVPVQEALAADDFETAKAAAAKLGGALSGVDMALLPHKPHLVWMEDLKKMNEGVSVIAAAADIEAARAGFEPLSVGLADSMSKLGATTGTPVFQLFCPMAFEFKGAIWLQTHEETRNPYFGASMLACGEVQKKIGE